MLRTDALDYELPASRIATHPVEPRDSARLLVVDRRDPSRFQDRTVRDLPELLNPGDVIVFNTTRVVPARFKGQRVGTGGHIEGLYLHDHEKGGGLEWVCLLKARHMRAGAELELHDAEGKPSGIRLAVSGRPDHEPGAWTVRVRVGPEAAAAMAAEGHAGPPASCDILARVGSTPIPPYILKARRELGEDPDGADALDRASYQTVYAKADDHGVSVAAPTAGLHFTPELLDRLAARGVERADVVLHVGAGTFKPVECELVEEHPIHTEWCAMEPAVVERLRAARARGKRVVCVGTTSVRTIESYAPLIEDPLRAGVTPEVPPSVLTRLLITPGYGLRWTDGLLTNFHLPRSTLMALVAALFPGDRDASVAALRRLYAHAIEREYRFYSFGDAMLVI